jgi:hypothetical protein
MNENNNVYIKPNEETRNVRVGTPRMYLYCLALAAGMVSSIGAVFSVTGLAKLFSGSPLAVMFMAGSLEFAKIVSAGFLHQNWRNLEKALRAYLSFSVAALSLITSLGVFGYLSNAYQKSSVDLKNKNIKIFALSIEADKINLELARLQKTIDDIPQNRATRRFQSQKQTEPEIRRLRARDFAINSEITELKTAAQDLQTEIGPLIYVADAFKVDVDTVARWLILGFVSIFDPLAICLVFAVSWSITNQQPKAEPSRKPSPPKGNPEPNEPKPASKPRRRRRKKSKRS